MSNRSRLRFVLALLSVLAVSSLVSWTVFRAIVDAMTVAYQKIVDTSVVQGIETLDTYFDGQLTLLSLYASVPEVREGKFVDLPEWLAGPNRLGLRPRGLVIMDYEGRATTTNGGHFSGRDREYFHLAAAGKSTVFGPVASRDGQGTIIVAAVPIPQGTKDAVVLAAGIDLEVVAQLLTSVHEMNGGMLSLATTAGTPIVQLGRRSTEPGLLIASHESPRLGWKLTAEVPIVELLRPVTTVLYAVGVLLVLGSVLVVVFFLNRHFHRVRYDELREDRTEALRIAYEQIRNLAYFDPLTRLPNRYMTVRKLSEAIADGACKRVFVLGLARFRSLSTTFGMRFGDKLLQTTSARLEAFVASDENGFVGRLGGSEFLILLDESQCDEGTSRRLIDLFQEPVGENDLRMAVAVHVGECPLCDAGQTADEVIKSAETALWAAREKGPNEASALTPRAVEVRLRKAELQRLLPDALQRGEIVVYYQPQQDLQSGKISGYEALIRWNSRHLGLVNPAEFIPIAEETGVILALGNFVLDQGIAFAQALKERGDQAVVSVNVSAVQFLHPGFLELVLDRVEASGLAPESLGLEITESILIESLESLRPALARLMERGITISLDDFGTGYSSLNYLKDLPLHVVKLDKSFIDALGSEEKSDGLIASIITLAHGLGLKVLAEGVERLDQYECLIRMGCDKVQGYYTGQPSSPNEHLARSRP